MRRSLLSSHSWQVSQLLPYLFLILSSSAASFLFLYTLDLAGANKCQLDGRLVDKPTAFHSQGISCGNRVGSASATTARNEKGECCVTRQLFTGNVQGSRLCPAFREEDVRRPDVPATSLLQNHTWYDYLTLFYWQLKVVEWVWHGL